MANEDNDKPVYGPTDEPEAYRDLTGDNVPQDPNEEYYPENDELPESYLEDDKARNSLAEAERRNKLGDGVGDLQGGLANAAKKQLVAKNPEAAKVQETAEKAEEVTRFSKNLANDFKNFAASVKPVLAVFANPYVWVGIVAALVITALIVSVLAIGQVFGQTKSSQEGSSGVAGAMQQRLAQRAEWLQHHYRDYGDTTGPLYDLAPGPKSRLSANEWRAACSNIVPFIYGLSPYLVNYNGNTNAESNWEAHPEMYESYSFNDGRSSPGASINRPPAGAIVSINYEGGAWGHTFVMLTDELVIDNWSGGGIVFGNIGGGPRIISDSMRNQITGWALPKSEGFEGTFITGTFEGAAAGSPDQAPMPDLPPVPEWVGGGEGGSGSTGGGSYNGPAERAAWMKAAGIAEKDWVYVDYIAMKESSWNPKATNASSGACGLIQALPCSKVPGNGYDPVDNLRWADGYAKGRYGSWQGAHQFWQANHWW